MSKKLIAFITASCPDPLFTIDAIHTLSACGADAIELGIPFSDPVADGPIIEKASQIALANGFKMDQIFDISAKTASQTDLFWMGYFNPFYRRGIEATIRDAATLGVKGFIIPDLPFEESVRYAPLFKGSGVANITFVAPTDSSERIHHIAKDARGFIYMVAYTGITGAGGEEDLGRVIADVRDATSTPLYIGFGVNAKTAKTKAQGVDGVIVGSAFMEILINDTLTNTQKIAKMGDLARIIKDEINA